MDDRLRALDRAARKGDGQAAERLYWETLRLTNVVLLLDRLIEAVLTQDIRLPSVMEKLAWVRNEAPQLSEDQLDTMRRHYSRVPASAALHQIPHEIRQPGFTTYCDSERQVYRVNSEGQWDRLASLSAPPPGYPFSVYQAISDRDENPALGSSCLVLENGGVYQAVPSRSLYQPHRNLWSEVRFERTG